MVKDVSVGLILWLFFMFSFIAVGYPIFLSIFFGILGGLSGGWIIAWWNDDTPPPSPEPLEDDPESPNIPRFQRHAPGIVQAQQHQKNRSRHSSRRGFLARLPFNRRRR